MDRIRLIAGERSVQAMAAVMAGAMLWLAWQGPAWVWALVPLGALAQVVNEYGLHRHIFHMAPPRAQWAFDLMWRAHYGHHDFPANPRLFFAPMFVVMPVLAVNFLGLWGVLALAGVAAALPVAVAVVLVGGVATFIGYEWFHTTAHSQVRKGRIAQRLTRLHAQHHFRDYGRWFHVTPAGEVIDHLMGTAISREALAAQSRIEFITTLGLRPDDPRLMAARRRFARRYGLGDAEIARAARL